MSIRVMSRVWDDAPYSLGTLLVLLALADWSDDEGLCWPKNAQLQKKTRLSERQVRNAMAVLEAEKVISVVEESSGSGVPRKYRIGGQYLPPSKSTGGQILPVMGANSDRAIRKNRHEPSVKPKKGEVVSKNPPSRFSQADFDERDLRKMAEARKEAFNRPESIGAMDVDAQFLWICNRAGITPERGQALHAAQTAWLEKARAARVCKPCRDTGKTADGEFCDCAKGNEIREHEELAAWQRGYDERQALKKSAGA